MVTLVLAERVPESVDWGALEPDHEHLGNIEDYVENGHGDETFANLRIWKGYAGEL